MKKQVAFNLERWDCIFNLKKRMQCHYSCLSCSGPVYLYKCLSCPESRRLVGSTCLCNPGLYEEQQPDCLEEEDYTSLGGRLSLSLTTIADVLFIINLVVFWAYVIKLLCRGNSPYLRVLVHFAQICSLLAYLPFRLDEVSHRFMLSLSAFSFGYFFSLVQCNETGLPTTCTGFENLLGYLLVLGSMLVAASLSSCIMPLLYQFRLEQAIPFTRYFRESWLLIIFTTLDLSTLFLSVSLARTLLTTALAFIPLLLSLALYMLLMQRYFVTVNCEKQSLLVYRQQNQWAYPYDSQYHLYYIDFMYQIQSQHRSDDLAEEAQSIMTAGNEQNTKAFFPKSNIILMEIIWKALVGGAVVFLFESKPSLLVSPVILLMLVLVCWMGAFFSYEKLLWWVYMLMGTCTLLGYTLYWLTTFWIISFVLALIFSVGIIVAFIFFFFTFRLMDKVNVEDIFFMEHEADREGNEAMDLSKKDQSRMKDKFGKYDSLKKSQKKNMDSESSQYSQQNEAGGKLFVPERDLQFQGQKKELIEAKRKENDITSIDDPQEELEGAANSSLKKFEKYGKMNPSNFKQKYSGKKIEEGKKDEDKKKLEIIFDQIQDQAANKPASSIKSVVNLMNESSGQRGLNGPE